MCKLHPTSRHRPTEYAIRSNGPFTLPISDSLGAEKPFDHLCGKPFPFLRVLPCSAPTIRSPGLAARVTRPVAHQVWTFNRQADVRAVNLKTATLRTGAQFALVALRRRPVSASPGVSHRDLIVCPGRRGNNVQNTNTTRGGHHPWPLRVWARRTSRSGPLWPAFPRGHARAVCHDPPLWGKSGAGGVGKGVGPRIHRSTVIYMAITVRLNIAAVLKRPPRGFLCVGLLMGQA